MAEPVHVVSISLGSSAGNKRIEDRLNGRPIILERRGTDGDKHRARELFRELDGQVDALGLGGTDLYLYAGPRRYVMREAAWLVRGVTKTPVLDGSGLKVTLEREAIRRLDEARALLAATTEHTTESLMALLRDEGSICRHPEPPWDYESSGAVIMRPATGDFWGCWGVPSENEFSHHTVGATRG